MKPAVLVPWQDTDCPHRRAALNETLRHWVHNHGADVRICNLPRGEVWCKAQALAKAFESKLPDVVIVADADCLVSTQAVGDCARIVEAGAPWAIPHWDVLRLTRAASDNLYEGLVDTYPSPLEKPRYLGLAGGGVVVIRTDVARSVPMDATYKEWGGEDYSWGLALDTLAGSPWRPPEHSDLVHLYHPRHSRSVGGTNLSSDEARRTSYFAAWAARDTEAMRRLVEGGRVWPSSATSKSTSTTQA